MKKTTIIIAGQRLWPIRWGFVLMRTFRAIYHLVWFFLGDVAMLALAINTPYVDTRTRWEMIGMLHLLGVNQDAQVVIALMVATLFMGHHLSEFVDAFIAREGE